MDSTIAPGFLVAAPHLRDPHFDRSVVLMLEHDEAEGSFGLIVNRVAEIDLAGVLAAMQVALDKPVDVARHPKVLAGGPVSPELGWIVHSAEWANDATQALAAGVAVTASVDLLKELAAGGGPREYVLCLGYAGWAPGQLVAEMRTGAWITVPFERALLFEVPHERRWDTALARLGIDPCNIAPSTGDA
jgi:putative transcriptional regulator